MPFSDPHVLVPVFILALFTITFGGLSLAIRRLHKTPRRAARKDS
jgi:hypothetical protein